MRGYYQGRYRDKHKVEAQVELRPARVETARCGGVGCAGTVFDKFSSMRFDHICPTSGWDIAGSSRRT